MTSFFQFVLYVWLCSCNVIFITDFRILQKTFEDYTERTAFERPLTSGVAYALRVRHFEREHIEQKYRWTIKKMDIEDQTLAQDCRPENFTTSPVQDEYAPVIFSQKTVSHIVSIDMMSGKVCFDFPFCS